jgi:ADP-dependent phosphofructokinase/glucokinase
LNLAEKYASLSREVCDTAQDLKPVYCGFSACIDHLYDLDPVLRALEASNGHAERALRTKLVAFAHSGRGGEIEVDWPEGLSFFKDLPPKRALPGGTGVQVACQLALFGARPVLALERRDPKLIRLLHPNVTLAEADSGNANPPSPEPAPIHPIIEFSPACDRGRSTRADRVIVRFSEDPIEQDDAFANYTSNPDHEAGAAVVSGFNALKGQKLESALVWGAGLLRQWRDIDMPLVHLELADFDSAEERDTMLDEFAGLYTSVGMNFSELQQLRSSDLNTSDSILDAVHSVARNLGVSRVTVHEDRWALSFTQGDPVKELCAIEFGCLTASARAYAGQPTKPVGLPADATHLEPPWPSIAKTQRDGHFVCCAAPYLNNPATTIGLGDSFLAGTLAVLAGSQPSST